MMGWRRSALSYLFSFDVIMIEKRFALGSNLSE